MLAWNSVGWRPSNRLASAWHAVHLVTVTPTVGSWHDVHRLPRYACRRDNGPGLMNCCNADDTGLKCTTVRDAAAAAATISASHGARGFIAAIAVRSRFRT